MIPPGEYKTITWQSETFCIYKTNGLLSWSYLLKERFLLEQRTKQGSVFLGKKQILSTTKWIARGSLRVTTRAAFHHEDTTTRTQSGGRCAAHEIQGESHSTASARMCSRYLQVYVQNHGCSADGSCAFDKRNILWFCYDKLRLFVFKQQCMKVNVWLFR